MRVGKRMTVKTASGRRHCVDTAGSLSRRGDPGAQSPAVTRLHLVVTKPVHPGVSSRMMGRAKRDRKAGGLPHQPSPWAPAASGS